MIWFAILSAPRYQNHVVPGQVLEKNDLVAKVELLLENERRERAREAQIRAAEEQAYLEQQAHMREEFRLREQQREREREQERERQREREQEEEWDTDMEPQHDYEPVRHHGDGEPICDCTSSALVVHAGFQLIQITL